MFRAYEIMAFEHGAGISLNYDKNACDRQSICYQTVLMFQMFSNLICPSLMES